MPHVMQLFQILCPKRSQIGERNQPHLYVLLTFHWKVPNWNGGQTNPGKIRKRSKRKKQGDMVSRSSGGGGMWIIRFVKRDWINVAVAGICHGLWTQIRRSETRGRRLRSDELTLKQRRNISPSSTPPDTRASSPTWSVGRLKLTWRSWWGDSAVTQTWQQNVSYFL